MKPINYEDAPAPVRAVFDDIKSARGVGDVNNFWKYLANEPRMLAHTWQALKDVMGSGSLDPLTKELIYMAVSITNDCTYCKASHGAHARARGASEEMMAELYSVVALANLTNRLAIAYDVPVDETLKDSD